MIILLKLIALLFIFMGLMTFYLKIAKFFFWTSLVLMMMLVLICL